MKEFTIQYFDDSGNLRVAHVKARSKEEAVEKFRKKGSGQ